MAGKRIGLIEGLLLRAAYRRWRTAARRVSKMPIVTLRRLRQQAGTLRVPLDTFIARADHRLALPRIGVDGFPQPPGTDWAWRPEMWRSPLAEKGRTAVGSRTPLGGQVTLFHDCRISELTMRQLRNTRESDLAPFGLRLDVFRFDGSFLSLVLDLPPEACAGLKRRHLIRVDMIVETEKPLEIFARLNVRHGPNTEQIVREVPLYSSEVMVEFDMAYSELNEKRVEAAWLDLIFENPEMNQVTIRDITFCHQLRPTL